MRKSAPVAAISASASGRIRPSGTGAGSGDETLGKVFALIGIEYRKAFQERDRAGLAPVAFRTLAFLIGHKTVGIDNRRAVFALANVAAKARAWRKVSQVWPPKPRRSRRPRG